MAKWESRLHPLEFEAAYGLHGPFGTVATLSVRHGCLHGDRTLWVFLSSTPISGYLCLCHPEPVGL